MDDDEVTEIINKKIFKIIMLLPLDEEWIIELKNDLVDILLKDPKFLNKFWKKKYFVLDCINKAFSNI